MRQLTQVAVVAVLVGCGCASNKQPQLGEYEARRKVLASVDDFNVLLLAGGVPAQRLLTREVVDAAEAERLLAELRLREASASTYGPRMTAEALLTAVVSAKKAASREELNRRLQGFRGLTVLTREGLLVSALTGEVVEWLGPVEVADGVAQARGNPVGALYAAGAGGEGWRKVAWEEEKRGVAQGAAATR